METVLPEGPKKEGRIKRFLRNPIRSEEPATTQVSLIDRLEKTPYAIRGARTETPQTKIAREILHLAVDVGETMTRYSASAQEVETAMIAITTGYGLKEVDLDVTYQSISVNYAPQGETPIQILRVARSWTDNFNGLVKIHELITDVVERNVNVTEARDRIRFINKSPKPYARWFASFCNSMFVACTLLTLGGGYYGASAAFFITLLTAKIGHNLIKQRLPEIYVIAITSTIMTVLAAFLTHIQFPVASSLVIASGILTLLPTMRLVSAVRDSITGYPVTAAGRVLLVSLLFLGIVAGISIGIVFISLLGLSQIDVTETFTPPTFWHHLLLIAISSIFYAINSQASYRLLLRISLASVIGFIANTLAISLGFGPRLTPTFAAIIIGFTSRLLSKRADAPSSVIYIPAIISLLPGLMIFRSTYVITIGGAAAINGATDLVTALMIALGIAAGVVLGDYLGQPLEQRIRGRAGGKRR
ncbi:MAG: threonine/serine exporter family protein [Micrococcaceae bacterium]